jgi:chromosome segregation ATPase
LWDLEEPVETQSEELKQAMHEETGALAVSVDDFAALEERVRRAVDVVKRERDARTAAEARAAELETRATQAETRRTELEARVAQSVARQADFETRAALAEAQLKSQSSVIEQLKIDVGALNAERDQVKQRVERLLTQLDTLEL